MKPEQIKKILVIRFSSLGDIILTTPLLKLTKEIFPDSEIDYLTKKEYSGILHSNPNITRIIETGGNLRFSGLRELKKQLKQSRYDLVLDAHNNIRTFYLKFFLGRYKKVFKKYSFRKFLLVKFKINLMKHLTSISKRYCRMLEQFTPVAMERDNIPEIFTDEESAINAWNILRDAGVSESSRLICIIPSSKHFTKTYPSEQYIELIKKLSNDGYTILLTGKGDDKKNIDIIKSGVSKNVIDLCNKLSLLELAEVMKRCTLVIGGDTGPMHIAEALGKPLIMLAGSSVREFGFYPQNEKAVVLEMSSLKCRPCSHIGRSECPLGHFKCMREMSPEQIYETSKSILKT